MEEWKKVSLREATDIIGDGLHGTPLYSSDGEFAFVNGNNLSDGAVEIKADTKMCDLSEYEKYKKDLSDRTLFLSINGTIGNTAKYSGEKIILGKSACYLNVKKDYNLDFLYYVLRTPAFQSAISGLATGTTIKNVSLKTIREYEFSVPDYEGQTRIARILRAIDDKIELNKRINHNLEEQAQVLYKSYFVDFEPFKDGKFVDSELGMIPEGWRVAELGTVTRQSSQKVKDRIDVKVLSPVTTGELVLSEEYFTKQVFSESISKYIVVKPLHFAYNPARVNIGSIGMNMFSFDGCVSPVYVVFECEKGYHHFFDYYRKTESFKDEVLNRAIGGVRQTLSYKDFALIKLVYPPYDIVEKFNCIYARLLENKNSIKREISKLSELRDTLLPKLLSGELKIDDFTC